METPTARGLADSPPQGMWQQAFDFAPPARSPLRFAVLGAGSGGNAGVVEAGPARARRRLLVDAGFSCRELERRMKLVGFDPATLEAVVLTHEHQDHNRGVRRLARRHGLPVWATRGTLDGTELDPDQATGVLRSGEVREVAGFAIEPFSIPHDAREPIGLVLEDASGWRLGLAADLGSRSRLAWGRLREVDALILETNHDLDMLRRGPYPWALKQRVAGSHGHLSNAEAALGLTELLSDPLQRVVLYHLSQTNNLPALAAAAVAEVLEREGSRAAMTVTEQDHPAEWIELT